jgi:hypothetical protein
MRTWIDDVKDRLHLKDFDGKEGTNEHLFVRCINGEATFSPVLAEALRRLPQEECVSVLVYNTYGGINDAVVMMRWPDFYKLFAWYFAARKELARESEDDPISDTG